MWNYNYSNYDNDYIMHRDHKYLDRFKGKNGKWVYVYNKAKSKLPSYYKGGWNDGERDKQTWRSVEDSKGNEATLITGSNSRSKYAGISIGNQTKEDPNYKYTEKSKKIGGVEVQYDNDMGMHNVTVSVSHETLQKGKSIVDKILGRNKK